MRRAVTYIRVSTKRQEQTGLGLDAQRKAVQGFVMQHDYLVDAEFIEVESGKNNQRPVLQEALAICRKQKAILLIAKLDRLGRNVAFISALMESGVEFKAVDTPYADKLLVHILAAIAEHERERISERTKDALQVAKARGKELGKYGKYVLSNKNKAEAIEFALKMKPIFEKLSEQGIKSIRQVTNELNRLNIPTYNNKKWHPTTVHNVLKRIKENEKRNT